MARSRGNAALIAQESLTPEETSLMEDNRKAQFEVIEAPEPAPAPDPALETKADPVATPVAAVPEKKDPEAPPADDKKRMVEYGALHEERERRKAADKEKTELQRQLATLTGRFSTLEELARTAAQQATPKPEIPDVNTDPVAHFQAELRARDDKIAQFETWQREQQQASQQQQQINQIRQMATAAEAEFSRETPDYQEAATYVQMIRNAQLEAIGLADPGQRSHQLAMEALNLAAGAHQRGQNPAAIIYQMAKASGWKPKAAEVHAAPVVVAPVPAAAPAVPAEGAKKLATVARGQAANQSLSQLSGSAPTETSIETLLKMSDEEFSAATKGDAWRKLFA